MVHKLDRRGYSLHISEVMNDYPGEDKRSPPAISTRLLSADPARSERD
ncbi:hypothetical protein MJ579_11585 [Klebsiella pneumoniae]|nr:hypothetical protein MJ579_11585 [Klebsiella pneumoniae]